MSLKLYRYVDIFPRTGRSLKMEPLATVRQLERFLLKGEHSPKFLILSFELITPISDEIIFLPISKGCSCVPSDGGEAMVRLWSLYLQLYQEGPGCSHHLHVSNLANNECTGVKRLNCDKDNGRWWKICSRNAISFISDFSKSSESGHAVFFSTFFWFWLKMDKILVEVPYQF